MVRVEQLSITCGEAPEVTWLRELASKRDFSRRGYILCETRLRASELKVDSLRSITYADAAVELLGRLSDSPLPRRITPLEADLLVLALLNEHSELETLCAEAVGSGDTIALGLRAARGIRATLDAIRLELRGERILSRILDDYGEVKAEEARLAELLQLESLYTDALREREICDTPGMLELLAERLGSASKDDLAPLLPPVVVLDQPTHLFGLEREIWGRISQITELFLLMDEDAASQCAAKERPTSLRQLRSVFDFVSDWGSQLAGIIALPANNSGNGALVRRILDGVDGHADAAACSLTLCEERTDEIAAIALCVQSLLKELPISQLHLVTPDVEPYRELLHEHFSTLGIPLHISKATPLSETAPGDLVRALLDWIDDPTLGSFEALFTHQFVKLRRVAADDINSLARECGINVQVDPATSVAVRIAPFLAELRAGGAPESLADYSPWQSRVTEQLLRRSTKESAAVATALAGLVLLRKEIGYRTALVGSERGSDRALAQYYRRIRYRLKELRDEAFAPVVPALRRVGPILREAARVFRLIPPGALPITTLVRELLKQATVPTVSGDGVLVTELLDVRGVRGKTTIVFGLTAAVFPSHSAAEPVFSPASEAIGLQLLRRSGAGARTFESLWLFTHVMRASEQVLLFAPCSDESGDMPLPQLLRALSECVVERRFSGSSASAATKDLGQREVLVRTRATAPRSEFDGDLSTASERWQAFWPLISERVSGADATTHYTVSELELFLDCAHRFYFNAILGLGEEPQGFEARLRSEVGSIVHRALERFARAGELSPQRVSGDFDGACRRLEAVALEALAESSIDWESEAVLRDMKREILAGLTDGGRRGYLRTALEIQREFLAELEPDPTRVEYRFNRAFDPSDPHSRLRISHELGALEVRGVIDRIDRDREGTLHSVWDYKTGSVPSRRDVLEGRTLQVPLYALAVQQNLGVIPKGGGVLDLKGLNRLFPGDEGYKSTPAGEAFVQEQLTLGKSGNAYVLDQAMAESRMGWARTTVSELDARFRRGDFSQKLDTNGCEYCGFRTACARDTAKLERNEVVELPRAEPSERPRFRANQSIAIRPSERDTVEGEQKAASDVEQDIALLAGAGSGKTHVLRTRVLRLLKAGEPIESILAITFTEKAAGEIRERLEIAISEVLIRDSFEGTPLSEQDRGFLREAQARFSEAQFGTIHSLAGRIVRMDPSLAGYAEGIEVAKQAVVAGLINRSVVEVVFERGAAPIEVQAAVEEVLNRGVSRFGLKSELQSVLYDRRKVALLEQLADPENETLRREMLERVEAIRSQRLVELARSIAKDVSEWSTRAGAWLELPEVLKESEEHKRAYFESAISQAQALAQRAEGFDEQQHEALLGAVISLRDFLVNNNAAGVKQRGGHPNYWIELRDRMKRLADQLPKLAPTSQLNERALLLAVQFAQVAVAANQRFTQLKRERGVVDFDDLIVGAARMLSGDSERSCAVRRRLQQQFRHLMVDEFQDTDPEQWAIVRAIADVKDDEKRSLFVVGDMQQSIYSFRGGDVRVFNDAIRFIEARAGKALSLRDNYRADPAVVEWVNECFEAIFALDFDSSGRARVSSAVRAQQMNAKRPAGAGPRIAAVHTCSARSSNSDGGSQEEQVAEFVQSVLRASEGGECAPEFLQFRALQSHFGGPKIAVLTRKSKDLHRVASALEAAGVPFSLGHSEEYFELDEVRMFENLLRAVADPWDSVGLVGVLRSPLVGLSDLDLVELYATLGKRWENFWRPLDPLTPGRFDAMRVQLRSWRGRARHQVTSALLNEIAEELQLGTLFERAGQQDVMLNIQRLFAMIREGVRRGELGTSPADTVRWLGQQRAHGGRKPNANSGSHPVVLMTIHASKGLEFPMVVLPFLEWKLKTQHDFVFGELGAEGEKPAIRAIGVKVVEGYGKRKSAFLQTLLAESEAAMSRAEERRVFYVACTRSRDFLAICGPKLLLPGANISQHESEAKTKKDRKSVGDTISAQGPLKWLAAIVDGEAEAD